MHYTNFVDVFHGCGNTAHPTAQGIAATWHPIKPLTGNTTPAATLPFGKYSVCAYSGGYSSGYGVNVANSTADAIPTLQDTMRIKGFAHFQNSGTGAIGQYYNYAVVTPYYGEKSVDYGMAEETGKPGYYAVTLTESNIRCELTASPFAAYHRYTFSRPGGRIAIDFENDGLYPTDSGRLRGKALDFTHKMIAPSTLTAAVTLQGVRLYFTVTFSGDGSLDKTGVYQLKQPGAVDIRVSVSAVNAEQSLAENRRAVLSFATVAQQAEEAWETALAAIDISCDDPTETALFYSNLYHTLVKPNDWGGGSWLWDDGALVVDFSTLWDMYKTQLPLLFTLYSAVSAHIVETFARLGQAVGHFPNAFMLSDRMDICHDQARMLTEHALYDAWKRGITGDWKQIFTFILHNIDNPDVNDFAKTGKGSCASHTLDMAAGCTAMAEMAKALGFDHEADRLAALGSNWKNVFDDKTGLLKNEGRFYEGNFWNYSFRPLPSMDERIALCGGNDAFVALLDRFFGFSDKEDTSARFEGFNNESDMESPYAYHYAGRYDRLCAILDAADRYIYRDRTGGPGRGGIPGNNDSGGMSSCYIWNCLGMFPVSGQGDMLLSRPKFAEATLHLHNGHQLVIRRIGNGTCPRRVTIDGRELVNRRLSVQRMMQGGTLVFDMD